MVINKGSERPLYMQIKDYILEEVRKGNLLPGGRVESESTIGEKFGVSRVTVRKAYGELEAEGYLIRRRGKGTFLRDVRYFLNLSRCQSFTLSCLSLGMVPSTQVLATGFTEADKEVAAALCVAPGTRVAFAERLRFADNVAVRIEYNYYASAYSDIIQEDLSASIFNLLGTKYGVTDAHESRYRISIEYTNDREAELLNTKGQTPILAVCGTMFDHANKPIYYTVMKHMPNRCTLLL